MDKSSTEYEGQGDCNDYEESEELNVHLLETDTRNESNDSEILPRKQKRVPLHSFSLLNRTGRS